MRVRARGIVKRKHGAPMHPVHPKRIISDLFRETNMNNMDNLIHALGFAALLAKNMNNMDNLIHALGFAASCYRRDARMVNFLRGKFGFLLAKSYLCNRKT